MAWKFLNIGKANAEVERLSAEVLKVTTERDEARTALEANTSEVTAHAEELQGQVTAANATIAELRASVAGKDTELTAVKAELQAAKDRIANPSAEIVAIAGHKAAEITGAQGQPPVKSAAVQGVGTGDIVAEYHAVKDPAGKVAFYRAHKAAIDAAWHQSE